jgi:hypothetical protein
MLWLSCDSVAVETCLQSLSLAMAISSGSTILALNPHVTIFCTVYTFQNL